jgi:hypothetical protein
MANSTGNSRLAMPSAICPAIAQSATSGEVIGNLQSAICNIEWNSTKHCPSFHYAM